jgi:S1-C subfamily serine protease
MDTAASSGFAFSSEGNAGFAIPITTAAPVAKDIEAGKAGKTVHIGSTAFLGVLIDSTGNSPFYGQYTGGGNAATPGVEIGNVVGGGPAQVAGLASGDTILSFNGQTITSPSQLTKLLVPYHPGQKVQLGWEDQTGQSHTTTVTLASGPPS